jgi:hypothetical protein
LVKTRDKTSTHNRKKKQNVTDKREQTKGDRETVKHMFWIL